MSSRNIFDMESSQPAAAWSPASRGGGATAQGVVNPDVVLEVFVSEQGNCTIIAPSTDGNSCVIAAVEGWDSDVFAALPES